jgi:hypothetical protein
MMPGPGDCVTWDRVTTTHMTHEHLKEMMI